MMNLIKIVSVLLFTSLYSYAQETGIVEGKIISSDGFPLSGIVIKLGKSFETSKSNTKGEFNFLYFPIGNHVITLEGEGLKKQSKEIKVLANETTLVEFKLVEDIQSLQEIVIEIHNSPNNKRETVLSGIEIKPLDLPQSVQIIGNSVFSQQQTIRLSDVVKNINGVYVGSARGGAQESFWSRGYDMSSNNMFKNGFRFNGGSIPEVASLEKVEVLKGSSALLFGNVTPGGILNMVSKLPSFNRGGSIAIQMGSYNFYKPSIDIYAPLNKIVAYRFTGSYENSESFRNNVSKKRYYINPSILIKASAKTEIALQGDYLKDHWTPDFGTGIIGREVATVSRYTYLGANWSNGLTKQTTISGLLKHNFNSNWKLNFNTSFQNYNRTSEGTERVQPAANGDWNRPLGKNKALDQTISEQLNLQGNFKTGKIKHQLFAGIDADNSFSQAYTFTFNPANYDLINIFDLELYPQRTDIPVATNTRIVKTTTNRFGIYAQDLISVTKKIKVLAGIRWSWQEAQAKTYIATALPSKRIDDAYSPKLGLVYQPTKNMSLFTSYSSSFTPNTGNTIYGEPIKASIIGQYEVGVKKDFWRGILSSNITFYKIINKNLAQTAELKADGSINTDTNIKILSGETTSKGIEVDIITKPIEGLNIIAGYSYNDMRYTKTSGATGSFIVGDRLVRTPANTANLSFFYTVPYGIFKGLSLGSMMNYTGKIIAGWNNTNGQTIPDRTIWLNSYTNIDFSAGYYWKQFSILCKLSNVSNVLNYIIHENYSVNPIAPRQIMTTLKYKF